MERQSLLWQLARFGLGLLALFGLIALVAHTLKPELEAIARWFFEEAGFFGVLLGTLLADGFFFPVPPQFYMLMGIATNASAPMMLVSIVAGSLMGGALGFTFARKMSRVRWLRERFYQKGVMKAVRGKVTMKGLVLLSITPIAFSWLVYFCGLNRYSARHLVVLCALRIPKLLVYYWLVLAGWAA